MRALRKSADRGHVDHGWLKAKHSFSFSSYQDPKFMGFRSLRVINEDQIAGGQGFPTHGHRDMEIITYIFEGALEHKDSMGNGSVIRPGDIQYMSAGDGVQHSEFNHIKDADTRLLQIWIEPAQGGGKPRYDQQNYKRADKLNKLLLVVSGDASDKAAINIRQDARLYSSVLEKGQRIEHTVEEDRGVWIQMISGCLNVNGQDLLTGDGLALEEETVLHLQAIQESEFLLFDLA